MLHLDSNIAIAHLNGDARVNERFDARLKDIAISSAVLAELQFGGLNSTRAERNLMNLNRLVAMIAVLPITETIARRYGEVRMDLKNQGRGCGDMDMLIAATALVHNATLVTHNTKHFDAVTDLKLEDWLTDG